MIVKLNVVVGTRKSTCMLTKMTVLFIALLQEERHEKKWWIFRNKLNDFN